MKRLADVLAKHNPLKKKPFISREFQDFGLRLAHQLADSKNKSLYIKLAKITARRLLEEALMFVKDAQRVESKAKLFMWKLHQLKKKAAG